MQEQTEKGINYITHEQYPIDPPLDMMQPDIPGPAGVACTAAPDCVRPQKAAGVAASRAGAA